MSEPFSLVYDFTANANHIADVQTAANALTADVEANEPDVLTYQFFWNPTTGQGCFMDTYASSEAFLAHAQREPVNQALATIMGNTTTNNLVVLGNVTPEAAGALAEMGATIIPPSSGFNRTPLAAVS